MPEVSHCFQDFLHLPFSPATYDGRCRNLFLTLAVVLVLVSTIALDRICAIGDVSFADSGKHECGRTWIQETAL